MGQNRIEGFGIDSDTGIAIVVVQFHLDLSGNTAGLGDGLNMLERCDQSVAAFLPIDLQPREQPRDLAH